MMMTLKKTVCRCQRTLSCSLTRSLSCVSMEAVSTILQTTQGFRIPSTLLRVCDDVPKTTPFTLYVVSTTQQTHAPECVTGSVTSTPLLNLDTNCSGMLVSSSSSPLTTTFTALLLLVVISTPSACVYQVPTPRPIHYTHTPGLR